MNSHALMIAFKEGAKAGFVTGGLCAVGETAIHAGLRRPAAPVLLGVGLLSAAASGLTLGKLTYDRLATHNSDSE